MQLRKNIATSESGFIFNPATGDSFSANPLAAAILAGMKEGRSHNDIKRSILDQYDTDSATVERDFDDFVLQLRDANLLEY